MGKYAIIVSILAADTRNQMRTLATALGSKISGRDPVSELEPNEFQRYVLAGTSPEIDVVIVVGVNADVTATVRAELEKVPPVGVQMIHYSEVLTRAALEAKLVQFAGSTVAAEKYAFARPGDTLTGFSAASFVSF